MKKSLLFLATAAFVLASCNNDVKLDENTALADSNAQKEISFSPYAQGPKHVVSHTPIDGTTFPDTLDMYVAAYQVKPTAANYFAGTQFIYNNAGGASATSGHWGGATARYWPLDSCYINFLAYANVNGTANFDATNYASAATITQTDNHLVQADLMYAKGDGQVTKSGNVLTFPGAVNMQFIHAQAWVDFFVKANDTPETQITVNSITLKGAKYAGEYAISHTNYNQKTGQAVSGTWSNFADTLDVVVPGWSATALTTSLAHVGHGLLVVPDNDGATADWTSFVVDYSYEGRPYNYTYTPASASAASLDQAKHYVFNITFKLHEIFVDATVNDWTSLAADTTNVTIQ